MRDKTARIINLLLFILSCIIFFVGVVLAFYNSAETIKLPNGTSSSANNSHQHSYTKKSTYTEYLKTKANCQNPATYYYSCSCGVKGSQTFSSGSLAAHTPKSAVEENRTEATCTKDGHYDSVVYCSACNEELSRETIAINAKGHTSKPAVEENRVEAICTKDGGYDSVVYCSACNMELSRSLQTIPATAHKVSGGTCILCGLKNSTPGLKFSLNNDGKTYTVTGIGTCEEKNIVIGLYNNMTVTGIGPGAFQYCDSLTSVTIFDSVTSIGTSAFSDCDSLTSVIIGNGVTSIGYCAFSRCPSLTSVIIGNGVTSIGFSAFIDCTSLTSVTIPDSVTSIGHEAFYSCESLTSVTIGNGVTSIGTSAFSDCTSLTSIKYRGTQAQWNSITKGSNWNYNTGNYTITYN